MLFNHKGAKTTKSALLRVLCAFVVCSVASVRAELTVFAASSMSDVMEEIGAAYGGAVRFNFASSGTLARQIEAGAPADVFVSANTKWMDALAEKQVILPETRFDFAVNSLVLVAPKGSALAFDGRIPGRLAIGDVGSVPAGLYAREALNYMGWNPELVMGSNVRSVLMYVERGEAAAGIVYVTDALASGKVTVVGTFPPASHSPIVYPVAACSDNEEAMRFLAFLQTERAQVILGRFGFNDQADRPDLAVPVDQAIWSPVFLSLKVALGVALATIVPAVLLGWLLARREFRGKVLVESLVHAPLVIPPVVTGYLLLVLLGRNGVLGKHLGLQLAFSWEGAVLASAIVALPLAVRSVRLAISMVDRKLEEASLTLGRSPLRTFLTITLPLAWPGILGGILLAFSRSLGEFGATITFAGNIEGVTRTLPLAIYSALQIPSGEEQAMRLTLFSLGLCLVSLVISELLIKRAGRNYAA